MPVVDSTQDWHLLKGEENDFGTVLKFVRKLNTCDEKDDMAIPVSALSVEICFLTFSTSFRSYCDDSSHIHVVPGFHQAGAVNYLA